MAVRVSRLDSFVLGFSAAGLLALGYDGCVRQPRELAHMRADLAFTRSTSASMDSIHVAAVRLIEVTDGIVRENDSLRTILRRHRCSP